LSRRNFSKTRPINANEPSTLRLELLPIAAIASRFSPDIPLRLH
jgi:hypothetical protein